jgi:hypothetical protein
MPLPPDPVLPAGDEALEARITELAAHIHAATYRLLTLIAELDRREICGTKGTFRVRKSLIFRFAVAKCVRLPASKKNQ